MKIAHKRGSQKKKYDNLKKNAKTLKYKLKETERLNAMPTLKVISKKVPGPLVDIAPQKIW